MLSKTYSRNINAFLDELIDAANSTVEESVTTIEATASEVDAVGLFLAIWARMATSLEPITESSHGAVPAKLELLAYHLYPFFGKASGRVTVEHVQTCARELNRLFVNLHHPRVNEQPLDLAEELAAEVRGHTEVVRGSAYVEQTAEEIVAIQGRFESWFERQVGIGPKRAVEVLDAIEEVRWQLVAFHSQEVIQAAVQYAEQWEKVRKIPPWKRNKEERTFLERFPSPDDAGNYAYQEALLQFALKVPVGLEDLHEAKRDVTEQEWQAWLSLLGFTTRVRQNMTSSVEVREWPLLVFPDKRVLVLDSSHALDILFDRFESIARQDQRFYERYQRAKASWLEEKIIFCLNRTFPKTAVYRGLRYPDIGKGKGAVAELDAAVKWGPFLLLIEAKARQFRLTSQLGEVRSLASDLKANIKDAFQQAQRASLYLSGASVAVFTETATGRELRLRSKDLERVFLLTVSQHYLAGMALRLAELSDVGLFQKGDYPVAMSIADLDTITDLCEGPDVLLHYLARREALQRLPARLKTDELELFMYYLDTRFEPIRPWNQKPEEYPLLTIGGYQDAIDDWMQYKAGRTEDAPDIRLQVPEEIREVLATLRRQPSDAARHTAFALLDLPNPVLAGIAERIQTLKDDPPPADILFRRLVFHVDDLVVAVVATTSQPLYELGRNLTLRVAAEKYRSRASRALGIGLMPSPEGMAVVLVLELVGVWEEDAEMEALLTSEPKAQWHPVKGQELPGRNAPCFCGSGRKFKHCCLPRALQRKD